MSFEDWTNLVAGAAILLAGFNIITLQRIVMRQQEQVARLTRRVWILEGSPPCDCCTEEARS